MIGTDAKVFTLLSAVGLPKAGDRGHRRPEADLATLLPSRLSGAPSPRRTRSSRAATQLEEERMVGAANAGREPFSATAMARTKRRSRVGVLGRR